MKEQFKKIELNPEDMLVTPLPDYFKKKDKTKMDTSIEEHQAFDVGIVEHIGKDLDEERVGKVIYYHSKSSEKINLKGIGKFDRVANSLKILIRTDQDINNY